MASDRSSLAEKTEEATPRKREEAHRKGQVAKSSDFNSALNLLMAVLVLSFFHEYLARMIFTYSSDFFAHHLLAGADETGELLRQAASVYGNMTAPFFLALLFTAGAANLIQTGWIFSLDPLKPKWEKLNFAEGVQRIFSLRTLVELGKNLLKIALVTGTVILAVQNNLNLLFGLSNMDLSGLISGGNQIVFSIARTVVTAYLALALLDLLYQKYQFKKNLRMTKQEVKEELKQTEGNPEVKSKQRERQRRLVGRRMMQEVPKATVVVTNPTHYAVALKYERKEMIAPLVVAKGADLMAEKIKQVAREHHVPLIENKPVARFLYEQVEPGESIPEELYQAVAEILALVYRKHQKRF